MKLKSTMPAFAWGALVAAALAVTTSAQAQVAAGIASGPPIWVVSLIGAMFAGTLALVGTFALKAMRSARASRGWPVATGTVLSGDIQKTERDSDYGTSVSYVPRLRYAYEVGGRRYESDRIRFGKIEEDEAGAREILERYAVGSPVQVRYDPKNPSQATLETKAGGVGLILFVVVVLAGLFVYMASVLLGLG